MTLVVTILAEEDDEDTDEEGRSIVFSFNQGGNEGFDVMTVTYYMPRRFNHVTKVDPTVFDDEDKLVELIRRYAYEVDKLPVRILRGLRFKEMPLSNEPKKKAPMKKDQQTPKLGYYGRDELNKEQILVLAGLESIRIDPTPALDVKFADALAAQELPVPKDLCDRVVADIPISDESEELIEAYREAVREENSALFTTSEVKLYRRIAYLESLASQVQTDDEV